MTRLSIYLIVGLIVGAMWVNVGTLDAGYVSVAWGDWQLETSAWLALSLLVVVTMLLLFLSRLVRSALRVPGAIGLWMGSRSQRGAQLRTDKGLAAFYEGRWDVAERALSKTRGMRESTLLHPLYAALSLVYLGKTERALKLLDAAEEADTLPSAVTALVRAESHLMSGALDQASLSLASLSAQELDTPRGKFIRCDLAWQQKDWREVCKLVADVRASRLCPPAILDQREGHAWCEVMRGSAAADVMGLWKQAPDRLKGEHSALWQALVERLGHEQDAENLYKAVSTRLEQFGEPLTLQCVAKLPGHSVAKLKKRVARWVDHDIEGDCHAALAHIAEQSGDEAAAGDLWQIAYERKPSPVHAARWANWLRRAGHDERASQLEAKALAALIPNQE